MRRNLALGLAALTLAAVAGVLAGPAPVRITAGILLSFALPGAALTAVLFRTRSALSGYERFTFIPGLSLATLVLGGLLAWAAGLPLERGTWLGVSAGVALLGLLAAAAWPAAADPAHTAATAAVPVGAGAATRDRGVRLPTNSDSTLVLPMDLDRQGVRDEETSWLRGPAGRRVTMRAVPLVLVVALLGGAAWLSYTSSRDTHAVEVVSLSASPPGPPTPDGNRLVRVTVAGLPAGSTTYTLVLLGETGTETDRMPVTAGREGGWTTDLTLPGEERMTIGLCRPGERTPFRTVIIAVAN